MKGPGVPLGDPRKGVRGPGSGHYRGGASPPGRPLSRSFVPPPRTTAARNAGLAFARSARGSPGLRVGCPGDGPGAAFGAVAGRGAGLASGRGTRGLPGLPVG
ncbi:hypothetical protein GCM10010376_39760 [Streptomyces violaceusniger]